MTDVSKILSSVPVNRQAAYGLTGKIESEKDELQAQATAIILQFQKDNKHYKETGKHLLSKKRRKELGAIKQQIDQKLRGFKTPHKKLPQNTLPPYFMEACKELMHPFEYEKYLKMAQERIEQVRQEIKKEE